MILKQDLLLEFLQRTYKNGNTKFLSVKDIQRLIFEDTLYNEVLNIKTIRLMITKLYAWGYLDINNSEAWRKGYRIKVKVLDMRLISPLDKGITAEEQRKLF